jgi:hypothetical protein
MKDDITYCMAKDCAHTECDRHFSKIDWNTPKHKNFGASVSDFSQLCIDYKKGEQ